MSENKFQAFLQERLPFGEALDRPFVDSAVGDPDLPDATSWEHLKAYLDECDADENRLNAAKHIWGLYVTSGNAWAV